MNNKINQCLWRMRLMRRNFLTPYTNSYTRIKVASRSPLYAGPNDASIGRSMVEMLGVLAIVGVLSVGAIAGYSKAMMKYRLNKHAEQLNTVVNAVSRNVHGFDNIAWDSSSLTHLVPYLVKMGEIPQEMVKPNITDHIYDTFGQDWAIFLSGVNSRTIYFSSYSDAGSSSLTTKSADNLAICQNMIMVAKENAANISGIASRSGHFTSDESNTILHGDCECRDDNKCLRNLTLDDIYELCDKHIGVQSAAEFFFYWRNCNLDETPF